MPVPSKKILTLDDAADSLSSIKTIDDVASDLVKKKEPTKSEDSLGGSIGSVSAGKSKEKSGAIEQIAGTVLPEQTTEAEAPVDPTLPMAKPTEFWREGWKPKPVEQAKLELANLADQQSQAEADALNQPIGIDTGIPKPTDGISKMIYGNKARAIMAGDLDVLKEVVAQERLKIDREKGLISVQAPETAIDLAVDPLGMGEGYSRAPIEDARKKKDKLDDILHSIINDAASVASAKIITDYDKGGRYDMDSMQEAGEKIRRFSSDIGVKNFDNQIDNYSDQKRQIDFLKNHVNYKFNRGFDFVSPDQDKYEQEFRYSNYATFLSAKINNDVEKIGELMKNEKLKKYISNDVDVDEAEANRFLSEDPVGVDFMRTYHDLNKSIEQIKNAPSLFPKVDQQIKADKIFEAYGEYVANRRKSVVGESVQNVADIFSGYKLDEEAEYKAVAEITGMSVDEVRGVVKETPSAGYIPSHLRRAVNSAGQVVTNIEQAYNRWTLPNAQADIVNREISDSDIIRTPKSIELGTKNITIRSVMNGVANGLGQFMAYAGTAALAGEVLALAPRVTRLLAGSRAGASPLLATGYTAETTQFLNAIDKAQTLGSTFATGYASSYEGAYQEAAKFTNDEGQRQGYAEGDAFFNGISELILPDVAVAKQLGKAGSGKILNAIKSGKVLSTAEAMAIRFAEGAKVMGLETLEEMVPLVYETLAKDKMFDYKTSREEFMRQVYETALITAVSTLPIAIGAGFKSPSSSFIKSALYSVGENPEMYTNKINDLIKNGKLSQREGNRQAMVVNTMGQVVPEVEQIAKDGGFEDDADRKMDIASQLFRKRVNSKIMEGVQTPVIKAQYERDNSEADAIIAAASDVDQATVKMKEKWQKNLSAITERTDITEEEKAVLREQEYTRFANDAEEMRQTKEVYFRVKGKGTKLNNILDDGDKIGSVEMLQDQALTTPHNVFSKLDNDADLTVDLIARNGVEKIDKAIDKLDKEARSEEVTDARIKEIDDHIILLERGKARAKRNEKIKGEPIVREPDQKDILAEQSQGIKPSTTTAAEAKKADIESRRASKLNDIPELEPLSIESQEKKDRWNNREQLRKEINAKYDAELNELERGLGGDENFIETEGAEMNGSFQDDVEINDEKVSLPESGFVISGVSLKEGKEKGKGFGQEIYKKALDKYGVLYSFHPISEDAIRVQDKLVEKGVAKVENIELPDGTPIRKITKSTEKIAQETKPSEPTVGKTNPAVIMPVENKPVEVVPLVKIPEEKKEPVEDDFLIEDKEKLSDALFDLANKIIRGKLGGKDSAQLNVFAIPQYALGMSVRVVATAVKAGEKAIDALQKGWQYLKDNGYDVDKKEYDSVVKSLIKGEKPRVRIAVGKDEDEETGNDDQADVQEDASVESGSYSFGQFPGDAIAEYDMRTSGLVGNFMTDATFEKIFGDDRTDDKYAIQRLADMLEDGMDMIGAAQTMFGGMDIMVYGPQLLGYLKRKMGDDISTGNKKAVLIATFLGELKTELQRKGGERARPLYNETFRYYRDYMNKIGKTLAAGRLIALYRDRYLAEVFHEQILEAEQVREMRTAKRAEMDVDFTDEDLQAAADKPGRQEADIKKQQAQANKDRKTKGNKRKSEKKKKQEVFKDRATAKEDEIKKKAGSVEKLTQDIINKIKNLNCK